VPWSFLSDVTASNMLSFVHSTLSVVVIKPVPLDVTIAVISTPDNLPQCRPLGVETAQVVFRDATVKLEALTSLGANLTFEWTLTDDDDDDDDADDDDDDDAGVVVDVSTLHGIPCYQRQMCTTSNMVCTHLLSLNSVDTSDTILNAPKCLCLWNVVVGPPLHLLVLLYFI